MLVTQSCPTLCDPMAPLSMGFSRQEYWSGSPFPSPGDLPTKGFQILTLSLTSCVELVQITSILEASVCSSLGQGQSDITGLLGISVHWGHKHETVYLSWNCFQTLHATPNPHPPANISLWVAAPLNDKSAQFHVFQSLFIIKGLYSVLKIPLCLF